MCPFRRPVRTPSALHDPAAAAAMLEPEIPGNFAILLQHAAGRWPHAVAIRERGTSVTYEELRRRAGACARSLTSVGVRPGDRVGILVERGVAAAAAYFGALAAGAVPVLLNETLRPRQVRHAMARTRAAALVTTDDRLSIVRQASLWWARVVTLADGPGHPTYDPVRRAVSDPAQIVFTSGSTGQPKGVVLSHANLWADVRVVPEYLGLLPDDRVISLLPFSSVYGLNQLICSVARGSTLVVERSPLIATILQTVRDERVSVLAAVPPLWLLLLRSPDFAACAGTLRVLQNAGGHLPELAVRQIRRVAPDARLHLMYGMTETMRSTHLPPEEVDRRPGSIGRAIPEAEVVVLRDDGSRCAAGEVGELLHRGPTVALGYWQEPDATAATFLEPVGTSPGRGHRAVRSGDLVRMDDEGFLYYVGRRDRMIKSMGYRVGPDEVTELLFASGEVAEAVIATEPDELAGTAVIAHVVLGTGGSASRLRAFCRREMPRYLQPRRIEVHDTLPRLPGGKYDHALLADAPLLAGSGG